LLGSFFARQLELDSMQAEIAEAELCARQHAERLEALWQIANNPKLREKGSCTRCCDTARTRSARRYRFRGILGRIEGGEARPRRPRVRSRRPPIRTLICCASAGDRPLERTIIPLIDHTRAWEDLARSRRYLRRSWPGLARGDLDAV